MQARTSLGKTVSTHKAKASPTHQPARDVDAAPEQSLEEFSPPTFKWSIGSMSLSAPAGIQTKLEIGTADDPLEREADRVAEQAMARVPPAAALSSSAVSVRRTCSCGGTCETCRGGHAPPIVGDVLRSSGQPLDSATRAFFEPRFGPILSRVRLHADALAQQSARDIHAQAYTVGRDIVFGPGRLSPGTHEGRRLLAHELAHVVQQSGTSLSVQRQPSPDPNAARDAAIRAAQLASLCSTPQVDKQADEEIRLKLDSRKKSNPAYALTFGARDKVRVEKHGLSDKDQRDIAARMRFFEGEAKAAYLRSMAAVLSNYPDQASEIMEPCATADTPEPDPSKIPDVKNTCDAGKKQFLLQYEGEPGKSKCMDIMTDPEYQNLFDRNIASAAGYAVPATTWENVDYDSFQLMVVKYTNGKSEYFVLDNVGNFYYGGKTLVIGDHTYFKRKDTGMIYPVVNGQVYYSEALTPRIIARKNGLQFQVQQLKDLYTLLQAAGSFAQIIALNAINEDFKNSIQGLSRSRLTGFKSVKKGGGGGGGGVTPGGGIPEPVGEETTARMGAHEQVGERVGNITIYAQRRVNGDTYEIDVWGLFGEKGRSTATSSTSDTRKTTDIRNVMQVVRGFVAEGKASGARELKVRGLAIADQNILTKGGVLKVDGLVKRFGGTASITGRDSIEIVIPLK